MAEQQFGEPIPRAFHCAACEHPMKQGDKYRLMDDGSPVHEQCAQAGEVMNAYFEARESAEQAPTNDDQLPGLSVDYHAVVLIDLSYGGAHAQMLTPVVVEGHNSIASVIFTNDEGSDSLVVVVDANGFEYGRAVHYGGS